MVCYGLGPIGSRPPMLSHPGDGAPVEPAVHTRPVHEDLTHRTAVELAAGIVAGEVSSEEVVAAHLDRIDAHNAAVNALVSLRPRDEVLADARAADARAAAPGMTLGPLHGLPVAVKDLEDVAGLPTRSGSMVSSDRPAASDGHVAARLRAAGAIIVGKTNTPEFGTGSHTFNEVFGLTRNPWALDRSAGGSSGGAAAALAARMLPVADGSDLGGSLRNPASFCNVVGLRPSIGRVARPETTSTHLVRLSVRGPMGRTVADTALVLSALAGPHPDDPLSLPDDPASFAAPLPHSTDARLAWGGDLGLFTCEPEVLEICRSAAGRIVEAGGTIVDAHPDLAKAMSVFRVLRGLSYRDLGNQIAPPQQVLLKETVRENIAFGRALDVDDVLRAERHRADLHRAMTAFWAEHDVLALPAAQVAPFPAEWEYPEIIAGRRMADYLEWMTACCVITPTGCPAISIPAGFTAAGLPVGLQLVAPVGAERRLLEIAAALEATTDLAARAPVPGFVTP